MQRKGQHAATPSVTVNKIEEVSPAKPASHVVSVANLEEISAEQFAFEDSHYDLEAMRIEGPESPARKVRSQASELFDY